jgi:hypothetical protein
VVEKKPAKVPGSDVKRDYRSDEVVNGICSSQSSTLPQMTLTKGKVGPATFVHLDKKSRDFRDFHIVHK